MITYASRSVKNAMPTVLLERIIFMSCGMRDIHTPTTNETLKRIANISDVVIEWLVSLLPALAYSMLMLVENVTG